jgi:hypothetical protein
MYNVEWLRKLLEFLHCPQQGPTTFYEDNESSIGMLTGTTKLSTKSKHIAWRYKYTIQGIKEGTACPKSINGEN